MNHGLLGDDSREALPDVPDDAFDVDDSGDVGLEMDGFEDGAGTLQFDDEEPQPATFAMSTTARPQTVSSGEPDPHGPPPMFDSLEEWLHGWLLPLYRRSLDGSAVTFCREWWRHPEAYLRLDALWKSWEFMRRKPGTGMAVWMRDYCDYHMGVLMREQGTFKGCTIEAHNHEYSVKPWNLARMPTERHLARLYDRLGVQHSTPANGTAATRGPSALRSIQTRHWDGIDQQ